MKSIKQLHDEYKLTLRPIKVSKGKLAGILAKWS